MSQVIPIGIGDRQSLKEAAISYARMGLRVIPVREASKSPPLINDWPNRASSDVEQVTQWWSRWPNANIAIVTGQKSGFFALDVDAKHNGIENLDNLIREHGELPRTGLQATGSGKHYLFKSDVPIKTGVHSIAPGIDIRGENGYIIAAPSIHPDGKVYQWIVQPWSIANSPDWLIEAANREKPNKVIEPEGVISEGSRDETLFKLACSLKGQGKKRIEIYAQIDQINRLQCVPPLSNDQVNKIVDRVDKYASKPTYPLLKYRDYIRSAELDSNSKLILHEITFYMDKDGKPAYPTQESIAQKTSLSRVTVNRKLSALAEAGHIVRTKYKPPNSEHFHYVYSLPDRFLTCITG